MEFNGKMNSQAGMINKENIGTIDSEIFIKKVIFSIKKF